MLRIACRSPKKSGFDQSASRLTLAVYGNKRSSLQLWNQQQRSYFDRIKTALGLNADKSMGFEGLSDPKQVVTHLKHLCSTNPRDCIEQIHTGWNNGQLPASEEILKEYIKAAASLKKLDTLDLKGLLLLINKDQAKGVAFGTVSPEALYAALNSNKRSAGSTSSEPMHVKCE
jgi:hypothetical protein